MKHKLLFLVMLTVVMMIAACSANNSGELEEIPDLFDVEILLKPEKLSPGEPVLFQAVVTQKGEPVEDADKVVFEIWKQGQDEEEHEKLQGEHRGHGVYAIKKTFADAGIYYVISHVDARGAHNMPKKEFTVGDVKADDAKTPQQDETVQQHSGH